MPGAARLLPLPLSLLLACLAATVAAQPARPAPPPTPTVAPPRASEGAGESLAREKVLPLDVTVNGAPGGAWPLVEAQGVLYAPREALDEWRVQLPPNVGLRRFFGNDYVALPDIPGYAAKLNFTEQSIALSFSAQAFASTRLAQGTAQGLVLTPAIPAGFLNYDLSLTQTWQPGTPLINDLGVLGEAGVSGNWGVVTSSFAGRNLLSNTTLGLPRSFTRLETTYTLDLPQRNESLRLGDSSTYPGAWGRRVFFGGVQWSKNFALTPGFVHQPLPVVRGTSAAPATVELYVNDVLRQVASVPAGPFTIDRFPAITGGGEARLVVRDILGRESIVTQPFFTSTSLLAPGLDDWSFELGRTRVDLGNASNRYGEALATATWRRGLTPAITAEGRGEWSPSLTALGGTVVAALPMDALGRLSLVASADRSTGLGGRAWQLGLERQGLRTGVYLQAGGASRDFRQLGQEAGTPPSRLDLAGNVSYTSESLGSFGLGFASLRRYEQPHVVTLTASWTTRIGKRATLSVLASHALAGGSGSSLSMNLNIPLDNNTITTGSANFSTLASPEVYASAAHNPDFDGKVGWRVLAGKGQTGPRAEGGAYYLGRYGRFSADVSASRSAQVLRYGASGGVVTADGHVFLTKRQNDAFAIAELKGYDNVGIGVGSLVEARTDKDGVALIPDLRGLSSNYLRIDPSELPISAEVDSIEQIVTPAKRTAVKVVFPVRSGRGALLRIVLEDGQPAPAGSVLRIEGDAEEFYVARRGEGFVTGLQPASRVRMTWKGQQCELPFRLPPENRDEIPKVGPLVCKGVTR